MNQKINECGEVNWAALKRLSDQFKDEEPFDIYDFILFHKFFNDLYNRNMYQKFLSVDAAADVFDFRPSILNAKKKVKFARRVKAAKSSKLNLNQIGFFNAAPR